MILTKKARLQGVPILDALLTCAVKTKPLESRPADPAGLPTLSMSLYSCSPSDTPKAANAK